MRFLSRASVRNRITALLAVLIALWMFAAWVTARESLNLLYLGITESSGQAAESVVDALYTERRLSVVVLGGATDQRPALADARAVVDQHSEVWREVVGRWTRQVVASDRLNLRYSGFAAQLDTLDELRDDVDAGRVDRVGALEAYTAVVDAGFGIYRAMSGLDHQEIARQAGLLVDLGQARELLARQDALLAGGLAAGELTGPELAMFTQLVGGQRLLFAQTAPELPVDHRARYDEVIDTDTVLTVRRLEDRIIADARPGQPPPVTAAEWDPAVSEALAALRDLEQAGVASVLRQAAPVVTGIVLRLLFAGIIGLVAVILSVSTGRTLIRQLRQVRDAAQDLADTRLPRVVQRLSRGEEVDVATEAPPVPDPGGREVGQLAEAFNAVQRSAVDAAVGQAALRRGVRDVFLSLARRTQSLVRRQLKALDEAEQHEIDPDKMAVLFRIDHLAARMRRNAENLIVLSGASTGRSWRSPVSTVDVARGATSEVEDYSRVEVLGVDPGALAGQVAGDVIHLLAELVENAVSYSPPYAPVTITGHRVARGFVFEIEDRGLGMSKEELAAVNLALADPPEFNLADTSHLGHYVVARLAERHRIKVQLRSSPYGGVCAVVLVPAELYVEADQLAQPRGEEQQPAVTARTAPAQRPLGSAPVPPPSPPPPRAAPGEAASPPAPGLTPAGLPVRVRQRNMPAQLWQERSNEDTDDDLVEQPAPDPEVERRKMSAFQHGTALGRGESPGTAAADGPAGRPDRSPDSQEG